MRFKVTRRGSVKPPDGRRVESGRTGSSDDARWLRWAARSGQIELVKPRPAPEPAPVETPEVSS